MNAKQASKDQVPPSLVAPRRGPGRPPKPDYVKDLIPLLARLVELYELDLFSRGLTVNPPDMGEGELFFTDDSEVADRIEQRKRLNGIPRPGFYVGDEPEGILTPEGLPRGEEVQIGNWIRVGSSWGLNVGPEGAEESGAGPYINGGPPVAASRDVSGQGDSPVAEG
jgi:hypothetical protein